MDRNEDGRRSGTERVGLNHYDVDGDQRILVEEYLIGLILGSVSGYSDAPLPEGIDNLLLLFVEAVNNDDATAIREVMRPELRELVDEPVLAYFLASVLVETKDEASEKESEPVTPRPAAADAEAEFQQWDENEDGVLTGSEAKRLENRDSNKDGEITLAEFLAGASQ